MRFRFWFLSIFCIFQALPAQDLPIRLSLEQAVQMALNENLELKKAAPSLEKYRQIQREANANRWAMLDFKSSYIRMSEVMELNMEIPTPLGVFTNKLRFGDENEYEFSLNLVQPIYTGGAIVNQVRAAQQDLIAREWQQKSQAKQITFEAQKSFFNLIQAHEFRKIVQTSIEQIKSHLKDVENFFVQGQVTQNEVLKVKVKLSEAELQQVQAEKNMQLAQMALLILLNQDLNKSIELDYTFSAWENGPTALATHVDLNQKAEVQAVEHQITGLDFRKRAARAAWYPNLSFVSRYIYGKPGLDKFGSEWMDYWMAGLNLQWNLWDWGKKSARTQQIRLAAEEARLGLEQLRKNLSADAERAWLNWGEAQKKLEISNQMLTQAEENFRIVSNQYTQGVINNTEFLDAQSDLTRSRLQRTFELVNLQIVRADYERATRVD